MIINYNGTNFKLINMGDQSLIARENDNIVYYCSDFSFTKQINQFSSENKLITRACVVIITNNYNGTYSMRRDVTSLFRSGSEHLNFLENKSAEDIDNKLRNEFQSVGMIYKLYLTIMHLKNQEAEDNSVYDLISKKGRYS